MHTAPLPRHRPPARRDPLARWVWLTGAAAVMSAVLVAGAVLLVPGHRSSSTDLSAGQGAFPAVSTSELPVPPAPSVTPPSSTPSTTPSRSARTTPRAAAAPRYSAALPPPVVFTDTVTVTITASPTTSSSVEATTTTSGEPTP